MRHQLHSRWRSAFRRANGSRSDLRQWRRIRRSLIRIKLRSLGHKYPCITASAAYDQRGSFVYRAFSISIPCNVSNPAQNNVYEVCHHQRCRKCEGSQFLKGTPDGFPPIGERVSGFMESVFRPFRNRLRRQLAPVAAFLEKLLSLLTPPAREVRSQRMCPFCGLITPRSRRSCLECEKVLTAVVSASDR
jgi:hypothetical protein